MSQKRLMKELSSIQENPVEGCTVELVNNSLNHMKAYIEGPVLYRTPFEGGIFTVNIEFSTDFPFKPPKVSLSTKVYHPNINDEGKVCLDILSKDWNPSVSLAIILNTLSLLLKEPIADNAVNPQIAEQMRNDKELFDKTARQYTKDFAKRR